jgi:putative MFS transporter
MLHLPDFYMSRDRGFQLVDMGFSPLMFMGMALIGLGLVIGLFSALAKIPATKAISGVRIRVTALDDRPLGRGDLALLSVMGFGLIIDVMKPATLGFILPGARAEYGLDLGQIALWPLVALIGTTIGSFLWGAAADRIGRRASVLLAALLFVATSVCGAMPVYALNLGMCFLMGISAGGMLPIAFALLAEIIPRVHRGWLLVTLGCTTWAGGYLAASAAAVLLEPRFGWRALWLVGLPTGVLLLAFSRVIPESPRFLARAGQPQEAVRQMRRLGGRVEIQELNVGAEGTAPRMVKPGARTRGVGLTIAIGAFGLSLGLVNFGLLTWLPTFLGNVGVGNGLLAWAGLVALPGSLLAPVLYSRWRTRASMIVYAGAIIAGLVGVGLVPDGLTAIWIAGIAVLVLLSALAGSNAMLQIYSAEVYPTYVRASGAGFAAGATKVGGILGPQLVALIMGLGFDVRAAAWVLVAPIAVGAAAIFLTGKETRARSLDEISEGPDLAVTAQ